MPTIPPSLLETFSAHPGFAAAAVMALWGAAQTAWLPRDGDSAAIQAAAARLNDLPQSLGFWTSQDARLDSADLAAAGAEGALLRHYRHAETGETVTVLLVCGRPSRIAVHPPTACYRGQGYESKAPPIRRPFASEAADAPHLFESATFERHDPSGSDAIELLWAWSTDGRWQAPDAPRIEFAGAPVLHKLYVARQRSLDEINEPSPQLSSFTELLVRELNPLFAGPSPTQIRANP